MTRTVVFIHTIPLLYGVFDREASQSLPDFRVLHVLDEPLLERVRQRGGLATEDSARLASHVAEAATIGAEAVLLTCSALSPCVDDIRSATTIPILKIDEAMIVDAVRAGTRIGVVATNPGTLKPTRELLEKEAARVSKAIDIEMLLVEDALPALLAGDGEKHDLLVSPAITELAQRNHVIVLAQASTARVLDMIPETARPVPVLSSPRSALGQLNEIVRDQEKGTPQ
jgi:Asp/Glu/hydantoin racemase